MFTKYILRAMAFVLVFVTGGLMIIPRVYADQKPLFEESLVPGLQEGGYVLYFRHAPTDWSQVDRVTTKDDWWSCNPNDMRQLSDEGRNIARKIGVSIRRLSIPIENIYASEYCRARETAEQFNLGEVVPSQNIMNLRAAEFLGGREAVMEQARKALHVKPPAGSNTIWVAHGNIIRAVTGEYPGEAGCIIFGHRSDGTLQVIGKLSPEEWTTLARQYGN